MITDDDCLFCSIIAGRTDASRIYEDDRVLVFLDIAPAAPGHSLVIPKQHAVSLGDLDPADGAALFVTAQSVAAALRRCGLPCEGVNLWLADGEVAQQHVMHLHLHLIPRVAGDRFALDMATTIHERGELDSVAARIRAAMPE